jgi:hypothetical protein
MAKLDELKVMWAEDCKVPDDLGYAAVTSPLLHSKYLNELSNARLKLTKIEHDLAELKAVKSKYFRGEMTKSELDERGWVQWQYRSLKADIPDLLEADKDIQTILARLSYMKTTIYFLESVMGEIKNRYWAIRSAIDWQKFRAGG